MPSVAALAIAPVKALGLQHPQELELEAGGVRGNRRFYLVDETGRLFGGTRHGPLVRVRSELDGDSLALHFPDGHSVAGEVALAEPTTTDFYGRPVAGRLVEGPWSDALSDYARKNVRLVRAVDDDAYDVEPATLVSLASCDQLGAVLGASVDPRRFRMLMTLDGCDPHEEDSWSGRRVRVGSAVVCVGGPVARCVVTTQDPDTGVRSLDTLGAIKRYRGAREGTKVDFGMYATVEEPGRVRVGDSVEPL